MIPIWLLELETIYILCLLTSKDCWEDCKTIAFFITAAGQVAYMVLSIIFRTTKPIVYLYIIGIIAALAVFGKANKELAEWARRMTK